MPDKTASVNQPLTVKKLLLLSKFSLVCLFTYFEIIFCWAIDNLFSFVFFFSTELELIVPK